MKKTARKPKAVKKPRTQKTVAKDVKIITEDDLLVVVGGATLTPNVADQI